MGQVQEYLTLWKDILVDIQDNYLPHMHICVFGMHMKQARVKISDRTNQVLNIVKAKYNLKDKSAAIELVVARFEN